MLHAASRSADWRARSGSRSDARRCSLMSGCRRMTPEPEQGASMRMRSKGTPSHHCSGALASAATSRARPPVRARFSPARASRSGSTSTATSSRSPGSASAICTVLPPGAAHASSTRRSGARSRSGTASWAAASCTDTAPSAKPGRSSTPTGWSSMTASGATEWGEASRPARRSVSRHAARPPARRPARRVIGARAAFAARIASQSSGQSARNRSIIHPGWAWRASGSGLRSRSRRIASRSVAARRSTAFASPRRHAGLPASRTVSCTAAWGGTRVWRIW